MVYRVWSSLDSWTEENINWCRIFRLKGPTKCLCGPICKGRRKEFEYWGDWKFRVILKKYELKLIKNLIQMKWWKFERFFLFWLQFLLKNHYFQWSNEGSPENTSLTFREVGGQVMGRSQDFFWGKHFSKIFKKFLKKIAKMHYFSLFFKKFNKACVNFCGFGPQHNLLEILRKFSKNLLRKLLNMHYFSIFSKYLTNQRVNFLRIWTKSANCWEILRKICKFLMKIL